jgi:alginate O-acetyltransferase complex protein AlgI
LSFVDPAFIFSFLPLALLCFYFAGHWFGSLGASVTLVIATLIFCLPYGWAFLALLLASTIINQLSVEFLTKHKSLPARYQVFVAALAFNFAILCILKYGIVFSPIPGAVKLVAVITAAVPVTVSFLTFQRAVMVLDAYQSRSEINSVTGAGLAPKIRSAAFSLTFPNLVIGPIAYIAELGPQLASRNFGKIRSANFEVGLTLFVIGLAKKVLIADPMSIHIVDPVFGGASAGHVLEPVEALAGMLGYYAQLYFDFSGYSDMALGIARLFGIRLPCNFNSPLRSTGIVDFYKRWHITLTRVIAKFMFTPLAVAGARFSSKRNLKGWQEKVFTVWLPILVNFEAIGIWHGAAMTFVMFGLFHGFWFILETSVRATKRWKAFAKNTSGLLRLRLGQIMTFAPMVLSFALFKSSSLGSFWLLVSSLANNWFSVLSNQSNRVLDTKYAVIYLAVSFAIIWLSPNAYEFLRRYRPGIVQFSVPSTTPVLTRFRWRPTLIWTALISILAFSAFSQLNAPVPFVYGGF